MFWWGVLVGIVLVYLVTLPIAIIVGIGLGERE
jgi:hypothetical protein